MDEVRVLGVGVATMDIYVNQKRMYPGGNEYNIACHVVNCGGYGAFLGVFANDRAGSLLESTLEQIGVDSSMSHHEIGSSGYSLVELKEDGDRVFLFWNQEGVTDLHPIEFNEEELSYVKSFDVCCLGRCASVSLEKIKFLSDNGVPICYDFHATFDKETIDTLAPFVTYAFFSCSHLDEEGTIEYLKYAVEKGCSIAIGTRGAEKLFAYDGKRIYEQEPFKVKAIDALGAGDSFIAAFLTDYIGNKKRLTVEDEALVKEDEMERVICEALIAASRHAAHVVKISGSVGIYYDIEPEKIGDVINGPVILYNTSKENLEKIIEEN